VLDSVPQVGAITADVILAELGDWRRFHVLGDIVEGQLRFPLAVRLPDALRASPEALAALMLAAPSGEQIPLSRCWVQIPANSWIVKDGAMASTGIGRGRLLRRRLHAEDPKEGRQEDQEEVRGAA